MILSIDQGTSSTKACIYDRPGHCVGAGSVPVKRVTANRRVTQDPQELVASCREATRKALREARLDPSELTGAALSNQGESFLLFRDDGEPVTPVIGWQGTEVGDVLDRLEASGEGARIERATGLPLHAMFSAPKLARELVTLDHPADVRFGTLDTWLIHELSPDRAHLTDRATASRTMLIGLDDDDWNPELLARFGVPRAILPEIRPCDRLAATLVLEGVELPLLASSYDMGLALLGHGCLTAGDGKATFGTCLGVMMATDEPVRTDGLLTTMAYVRAGSAAWALDGEIAAAGALVDWAIRAGIASSLADLEARAGQAGESTVVLVPAIQGLGAPHWRDDVSAAFFGITDETGQAHLARAVLDALAWSLHDVAQAFRSAGGSLDELSVDGGLTHSRPLLQRCADVLQLPLRISDEVEATASGGAMLAMLASGAAGIEDVRRAARGSQVVHPGPAPHDGEREAWQRALTAVLG
jgi:glycerol kinase